MNSLTKNAIYRHEVLEMLTKFHVKSTYHPGEFYESHVLRGKGGNLHMVGFNAWYFGETILSSEEVGCDRLRDLGIGFCV